VYVAVPVILLVGIIGFVVLRGSSDTPAPGAARSADPSSFGTAPVGTALVPASTSDFTVETIRALSDGGLAFTWSAPDLQADPAFQVSIDGKPATPDFLATDPSTGQALQEQVVTEVTLLADGTKRRSTALVKPAVGGGPEPMASKCLDKRRRRLRDHPVTVTVTVTVTRTGPGPGARARGPGPATLPSAAAVVGVSQGTTVERGP
jgi:hypothetical protein